MKLDSKPLIKAYNEGKSLTTIAKEFHTYPTSIKRILEKEGVKLRHDAKKAGEFYVQDGEKLIEWAKAQGRLVSKDELAAVLGKSRLSPSYFSKYPELSKYVLVREQKELHEYNTKLYEFLQKNNIQYKPNDRKKLGVTVNALLLGEYSRFAIQINIKPSCISEKLHLSKMQKIYEKSKDTDIVVLFIDKNYFKDLNVLKSQLDDMKSLYT